MKDESLTNPGVVTSLLMENTLESEHVYDGPLMQVYTDRVELPDKTTSTRDWIKHPGASAVVPVFEDGTIMLLKQFRYPARKVFIEVPAGKLDPGELPHSTAKRELLEESGIRCKQLVEVGSFYPAIGYADEIIYTFVAWDLKIETQNEDDDEFLLNYRIPFLQAIKMIETGEISDGKTICTLLHAAMWWKKNGPFKIEL